VNNTAAGKSGSSKLRRYIGIGIFVVLLGVLLLMFRKPTPVAAPMKVSDVAANAESFQQKLSKLSESAAPDVDGAVSQTVIDEVHLTTEEVQAALVQANLASDSPQGSASTPTIETPAGDQVSLQSGAPVVTFENNVVKGQFQSELAGQKVVVTVAGHLGAKDGYATFEPTQFKIGEVIVPVSMVNGELQKKLAEQHDRLKLPDFVSDISIENGQLVIKRK
jgi:hypothetical protein